MSHTPRGAGAGPQPFPEIRFQGKLRPSQSDVQRIAQQQLDRGTRRLHIVAPPGSGKTVIGLYLWAELVRRPALVLSPNSAIQAQWAARSSLFTRSDGVELAQSVSTSTDHPGLLTSLTYQSVTLPMRATEALDTRAMDLWIDVLLEESQAESHEAAEIWVNDLRVHNQDFFDERLAYYRGKIRENAITDGNALDWLHESARETLRRLRDAKVGLLILDECHHLMGHWGRVLAEVEEYFGDPVIVGLTATPPERQGRKGEDIERYDQFFGDIDYEVPVPAVVKDGFLAPYQDLAYFVRPTSKELRFIARVDEQFHELIDDLCQPRESAEEGEYGRQSLIDWVRRVLTDKQLPTRQVSNWGKFHAADTEFAEAAVHFLNSRSIPLPADVPALCSPEELDENLIVTLVDRYTRHHLRRSQDSRDHTLAQRAIDRLRMLGVQITDKGSRPCASPVGRVIAYTRSKTLAVVPILQQEMKNLGEQIRAVVIADYEKTSAITSDVDHLLDKEAGGAVAAFRAILNDPITNELDPVLLTGSTVLSDADLVDRLLSAASNWLKQRGMRVKLTPEPEDMFCIVRGKGADWCPRVYVELFTELFQQGLTRCLVGTRGLLGEGWDANTINVLVDLSTVTTSMTVNQLRGRSIRLDPNVPDKLANNWDVVCIAPEFTKGLDDYRRFIRKHQTVFGICDDGAIEKGVGHVHAAFTELKPELLDGNINVLNADMLARSRRRDQVYQQWNIGKPYSAAPIRAVEVRSRHPPESIGFPPFKSSKDRWTQRSLAHAIGQAVLSALQDLGLLKQNWPMHVSQRDGGFVRVFLQQAEREDAALFATALQEAMGPVHDSRYVIPRFVEEPIESLLTRWLPEIIGQFFERRERRISMLHAVPSILATKRARVDVYQKRWNELVSPGEAVYSKNDQGQQMIREALRDGYAADATAHDKEIFL